jgi:hypothetical protein
MSEHGGQESCGHSNPKWQQKVVDHRRHVAVRSRRSRISFAVAVLAVEARVACEARAGERGELAMVRDRAVQLVVGDVEAGQEGELCETKLSPR